MKFANISLRISFLLTGTIQFQSHGLSENFKFTVLKNWIAMQRKLHNLSNLISIFRSREGQGEGERERHSDTLMMYMLSRTAVSDYYLLARKPHGLEAYHIMGKKWILIHFFKKIDGNRRGMIVIFEAESTSFMYKTTERNQWDFQTSMLSMCGDTHFSDCWTLI